MAQGDLVAVRRSPSLACSGVNGAASDDAHHALRQSVVLDIPSGVPISVKSPQRYYLQGNKC
jgi:hypothetical protein